MEILWKYCRNIGEILGINKMTISIYNQWGNIGEILWKYLGNIGGNIREILGKYLGNIGELLVKY